MIQAVVSILIAQRHVVSHFLTAEARDTVTGGGRSYTFYPVAQRGVDMTFADPNDGQVLVECKYFDNEVAAHDWVAQDIAIRAAQKQEVH